jgi:hypothetical protein
MGVPSKFNDIVQKHLHAHAAWMPIANNYRLGDYGLIAEGVFNKMGNIQDDFGVAFETGTSPDVSLDFVSADTTVVNTVAGAQVDVIPDGAVGVKVSYKFNKAQSFLVKAASIKVKAVENLNKLVGQLQARSDWESKWRVVWQTYHAENAAVLSTMSEGTAVDFSGDAEALKKFNLGDVSASIGVNVSKELGLKLIGKSGVIGLGLFKLHWLTGGPSILSDAERAAAEVKPEVHEDWDAPPQDDV